MHTLSHKQFLQCEPIGIVEHKCFQLIAEIAEMTRYQRYQRTIVKQWRLRVLCDFVKLRSMLGKIWFSMVFSFSKENFPTTLQLLKFSALQIQLAADRTASILQTEILFKVTSCTNEENRFNILQNLKSKANRNNISQNIGHTQSPQIKSEELHLPEYP